MVTRLNIIDQLETDLKRHYKRRNKRYNTYHFTPKSITVGSPDTVSIKQYPAISFYGYGDPQIEASLGGPNQRIFQILLTGYVKASKWKDIYKLCEDIEHFLYSDDFGGDLEIGIKLSEEGPRFYGNVTMLAAGLACFDLEFTIQYTQNI